MLMTVRYRAKITSVLCRQQCGYLGRMMVELLFEQPAVKCVQDIDHMRIGLEHLLAREQRRRVKEAAVAAHRIVDFEPITAAHDIVIQLQPFSMLRR